MTRKNPNAVALGSMGKGRKKTMSPEAIRQRQEAAKASQQQRAAKETTKMNIRDITYETARQFSEIAASQKWIEERMVEIEKALNRQQKRFDLVLGHFDLVLGQLGIVVETKKAKRHKIKHGSGKKAKAAAKRVSNK